MSQNGCNIHEGEILQETQGPAALSGATPFSILCLCGNIFNLLPPRVDMHMDALSHIVYIA